MGSVTDSPRDLQITLANRIHLVTAEEIELARERVEICLEAVQAPTDEQVKEAEGLAWEQIKQHRLKQRGGNA